MRTSAARGAATPARTRSVLLQRDFGLYWYTSLMATSGMWLWRITSPVIMFELTRSPVMLGLLSVASYGPILTLSLVGGVLADRFPRRLLISCAHVVIFALFLALAFMSADGRLTPAWLFAVAVIEGVTYSLAKPALQALVTELVSPAEVPRAVAINVVQFSIAQLVGPGIATALLVTGGHELTLAVASALYVPLGVSAFFLRMHEGGGTGRSTEGIRALFRGGIDALRIPSVGQLLLAIAFGSIALEGAVRVLAPQFVTAALGHDERNAGIIISSQAAGSIASVVVVGLAARRDQNLVFAHRAFFVMAAAVVAYAAAPTLPAAMVIAALVGGAQTVSFSIATGMIHHVIPTEKRGRVMAFHSMALLGVRPIAGVIAGGLASRIDTRLASGAFVVFTIAGALMFASIRTRSDAVRRALVDARIG